MMLKLSDYFAGKTLEFTLKDLGEQEGKLSGVVLASDSDLCIQIDGYGDHSSEDGYGTPIYLELYNGELRLLVWPDINEEEPLIISLKDALESSRLQEGNNG